MSEPRPTGDSGPQTREGPRPGPRGMWLSDLSIRQPVFIAMLVLAVAVVGVVSYSRMGLELFPDISLPIAVVQTVYPGASPEEVERSVTKPIEDAVSPINGVETVRSMSTDSVSLVVVQFNMGKDAKAAADDVQSRVNAIRSTLPSDIQTPVVQRFDFSAAPILSLAVSDRTGKSSPEQLRRLADEVVKPRLEQVAGVAAVTVVGGQTREVHVDLSLSQLEAHGISPQLVIQAIRAQNVDVPAGRIADGQREELLRTAGEVQSLSQLGEIPVAARPEGAAVRVKNLADLSQGPAETRAVSRLDGRDSVVASVQKQSGTNTVQVADAVKRELERLREEYADVDVAVAFDQSTFTREAVADVQTSLLLGALLAALVVLVFFRDIRNTLVTVAGLPVIILGTFGAMHALGLSLNMITLMALSLSTGMLIDDAIVVRENIFRHMEAGEEPRVAASRGTAEIALAVVAVTSTIVAVFLPIGFTEGMAGRFLRDFGITIAVAILISLVEAFTLAPMLSAYFFGRIDPSRRRRASLVGGLFGGVAPGYRRLLGWSLRHRFLVVLVGLAVLGASLGILPRLAFSFVPPTDRGEFGIGLELPPGSGLAETDRATRAVEEVLQAAPEVEHVFTTVGSDDGSVEKASADVKLRSRGQTDDFIARVRPDLERALGAANGAKLTVDQQANDAVMGSRSAVGAVRGRPIQFGVQGSDYRLLDRVSADLASRLQQVPGLVDVDRSLKPGKPGRTIVVDRAKATDQGVTIAQAGATVRALVNGEKAGTYRAGGEDLDIVVRLAEASRDNPDDVLRVPVTTARGTQIKLSEVASLVESTEPSQIDRENRQRQVVVGAGYAGRNPGTALAKARAVVAGMSLPEGVTIKVSGQAESQDEMLASLGLALELSVLFVYMILASQFGSFVHPFTIMLALPFSVVGALLALFGAGLNLDMLAMIGIILLMGLVTKNSILLVEFVNQLRRRGLETREAILEAGPIRLRPILMTTLAMIFGMVPVAAGLGAGSELRRPMGVTVIGGLITSTLLTLVIVPVAYTLVEDLGRLLLRLGGVGEPGREGRAARPSAPRVVAGLAVVVLLASAAVVRSAGFASRPAEPAPARSPRAVASVVSAPLGESVPLAVVTPAPTPAMPSMGAMPGMAPPQAAAARPPQQPAQQARTRSPAQAGGVKVGNTEGLGVNVRESPAASSRRVTAVPDGTALTQVGQAADQSGRVWAKVQDPRGVVGWVPQEYLVGGNR